MRKIHFILKKQATKMLTGLLVFSLLSTTLTGCKGSDSPETSSAPDSTLRSTEPAASTSANIPDETGENQAGQTKIPDTSADDNTEMSFSPCNEIMYTTVRLNLRANPSTDAAILTVLPKDTALQRIGIGNGWSKVTVNNITGYVASQYLTATASQNPTEAETEPADPFTACDETVYTTRNLNLRTLPDTDSDIITVLPKGTPLHRTGIDGDWSRVEINQVIAYVASKYVSTIAPITEPEVNPTMTDPVVVPETKPSANPVTRTETANGILYTGNAGPLIAIDPGHQSKGNNDLEPIAPGSTEMKKKVSYGTSGCVTKVAESQLNLIVSIRLRDVLLAAGYNVLMIRETQEVDISNVERAQHANAAGAAAFVRIHANGSSNSSVRGVETVCPRTDNPYMSAELIRQSRNLSQAVVDAVCAQTGATKHGTDGLYSTNNMTGINWCTVPVTILEMGYLSNAEDDALLVTPEYQEKIVAGICAGLNTYFGR